MRTHSSQPKQGISARFCMFVFTTSLVLCTPLVAHAQGLQRIIDFAADILNFALAILIGVAIATFFWGLVKYLFTAQGGPEQSKASTIMVWGLVALFFMLSVFGIVRFLQVTFGLGVTPIDPPALGATETYSCSRAVENFACFAEWLGTMFGAGTALLVGGALVLYFWGIAYGMFGYSAAGSATGIEKLRGIILWGLLAIFVMFSIWGIIRVLGLALFGTSDFNSLL